MRRHLAALTGSLLVSVAILFPPLPLGADECPTQDQQDQVVLQGFNPAVGVIKLRQAPSQTPTPEEIVNHPGTDIRSAHWSVHAKPTVVELGFDQQAISDFIGPRWLDSQGTIKDDRPMDFQWVQVDKEEGYLLLVLVPGWRRNSSDALHIYKSCTDVMKRLWNVTKRGTLNAEPEGGAITIISSLQYGVEFNIKVLLAVTCHI